MIQAIRIKLLENFLLLVGIMMFFTMVFAPFEAVAFKIAGAIILVIAFVVKAFILDRIYISKEVLTWLVIFILHGIFFTALGILTPGNNKSFVIRSASVNVVWPILYGCLLTFINKPGIVRSLVKVCLFSLIAIGAYLLLAGLSFLGMLPLPFEAFTLAKPIIGKYEASVQLFLPATTSLLYLIPFFISCLLLGINNFFKLRPIVVVLSVILGILATIITARRALILNILISPVFVFMIMKACGIRLDPKIKKRIIIASVLFLLFVVVAIYLLVAYELFDFKAFAELFIGGFNFGSGGQDESASVRGEQFKLMMNTWRENPLLGSGHGTFSQYIIRSDQTPWVYELSYVALLFQIGIVGIVIYFALLAWILYKSWVLIKEDKKNSFLIPGMVAYICFLIGNASNPYMVAFDHMWMLFLPLGFINYVIITGKTKYVNG